MLGILKFVLYAVGGVYGAQYGLVQDYSGVGFFDGWVFYDHCASFFSLSIEK